MAAGDFVGRSPRLRVWEPERRFFILTEKNDIRVIDFAGKPLWSVPARVGGNPSDGWRGGFDVDDAGRLLVLEDTSDLVRIYDASGRMAGELRLQMGERKGRVSDLRVHGDDILVRRPHPVELFL